MALPSHLITPHPTCRGGYPQAMTSRYRRGVIWYRLDLRTADHPALTAAARDCDLVLPVFLMHEHRMRHPLTAPLRAGFLLESIAALQRNLERLM